MNPARSLSPALLSSNLDTLWVYIIAPILGTSLAPLLYQIKYWEKEPTLY
jgi:aquaporin NIP